MSRLKDYYCEWMDASGVESWGTFGALSEDSCQADLRSQGYFITKCELVEDKPESKCESECSRCANRVGWNQVAYNCYIYPIFIIFYPLALPLGLIDVFLCWLLGVKSKLRNK